MPVSIPDNDDLFSFVENETIPENAAHWEREHFIPVARADWRVLITDAAVQGGLDHDQFGEFCALLDTLIHMSTYHDNASISESYSLVDPDNIGGRLVGVARVDEYDGRCQTVIRQFDQIMVRGNYQKLSRTELLEALDKASEFGMPMQANFSVFKRIAVYVRGKVVGQRTRRRALNFYRKEELDVPLFQRLVICFQVTEDATAKDEHRHDCLYIKSFKNIPQHDIDMLLPGTSVRMSFVDRGKIALPTISGLAMLTFRIVFLASMGLFAFLGLLFTTSGYAVKSIFGYIRTKDRYQHSLTKNLYYQNLGNNAGVLQQMQMEAEVQDIQECLLGYTMLITKFPDGATMGQLDKAAEDFIQEVVKFPVDFEVDDALRKLVRLNIVSVTPQRMYLAWPLDQASAQLQAGFAQNFTNYNSD